MSGPHSYPKQGDDPHDDDQQGSDPTEERSKDRGPSCSHPVRAPAPATIGQIAARTGIKPWSDTGSDGALTVRVDNIEAADKSRFTGMKASRSRAVCDWEAS